MTIRLKIDMQNKEIVLTNTEIKKVSRNDDTGMQGEAELWCDADHIQERMRFAELSLFDVDFEGFVFHMVDRLGNEWSTELFGQVI